MRVFLTGATGFVGSAIIGELRAAGHGVLGLARSDAGAAALTAAGVAVHRGALTDTDSLVAGLRDCEGVIHCAFIHDFSAHLAAVETDRLAVTAMTAAMEGTGKPFILTSGTAVVTTGRTITEADAPDGGSPTPRGATEAIVMAAAERGVRGIIMRLPPSVHGQGDHGFIPTLIGVARRTGVAAYVGDGANRWPAGHRLDVALLYRLALEQAAPGTRLHAAAEEGIAMRSIAEAIGAGIGVPVRGLPADQAAAHFEWMARFVGLDNPVSSTQTRAAFGWDPRRPGLLADMRDAGYFV